jgi:hypothetical protein
LGTKFVCHNRVKFEADGAALEGAPAMPKFFVPNTGCSEAADEAYASMRKHNYIGEEKPGRLVRIVFDDGGRFVVAQVGHEFRDFPEPVGEVLAIIETTNVVTIHTATRTMRPIPIYPPKVRSRQYFDDYPALS